MSTTPERTATFDFTGATVLVTGGSSGIGHATARAFRDSGASVVVTGTRPPDEVEADLAGLEYRRLELRDGAAVDALGAELDRLDVLVNNAGANFPDGRDEWQPDVFAEALAQHQPAEVGQPGVRLERSDGRERRRGDPRSGKACAIGDCGDTRSRFRLAVPQYGLRVVRARPFTTEITEDTEASL